MTAITTSDAEWTVIVHVVYNAIYIRGILGEIGFPEKRVRWFCDNRGAIQAASQIGLGGRTKTSISIFNAHTSTWKEDDGSKVRMR